MKKYIVQLKSFQRQAWGETTSFNSSELVEAESITEAIVIAKDKGLAEHQKEQNIKVPKTQIQKAYPSGGYFAVGVVEVSIDTTESIEPTYWYCVGFLKENGEPSMCYFNTKEQRKDWIVKGQYRVLAKLRNDVCFEVLKK